MAFEPAECVPLGETGVEVTRLGLGAAPIGGLFSPVADADAERVVRRAWDLGIRYFDVAPLYGYGAAERRLGAGLRGRERVKRRQAPPGPRRCGRSTTRRTRGSGRPARA